MLEDNGPSEIRSVDTRKERCKPDYETMIANLQKRFDRAEAFQVAALGYFEGKRARNKMAELIGELVTECNMLSRELKNLLAAQEADQD